MAHGERRKALIVGINDYPGAPLRGCVNDAKSMEAVLRKHAKKDPNFDCTLLLSEDRPVAKAALYDRIKELFAHESDIALLYFSGHGGTRDGRFYLVAQDYTETDWGVDFEEVLTLANQSAAKEVMIILDCCHAGQAGNLSSSDIPTTPLRAGVSILAAALPGQAAQEKPNHEAQTQGKFTTILVRGLQGAARDLIGHVSAASLFAYADPFLTLWEQRPMYKAHVSELTALRYCYPIVKKEYLRDIPDLFPQVDGELRFDDKGQVAALAGTELGDRLTHKLIILRRHGLVEGLNGFTITKERRIQGGYRLTDAGKDIHLRARKNRI
jgi:hypothetical protein